MVVCLSTMWKRVLVGACTRPTLPVIQNYQSWWGHPSEWNASLVQQVQHYSAAQLPPALWNSTTYNSPAQLTSFQKKLQITSNLQTRGKLFIESENEYAHSVMEENPAYKETLCPPSPYIKVKDPGGEEFEKILDTDWTTHSPGSVVDAFLRLSYHEKVLQDNISDTRFDGICTAIVSQTPHMSDVQLLQILQAIRLWHDPEAITAHNYKELWNCLDGECYKRMINWDAPKMLLVADHWYRLRLGRVSTAHWAVTRRLGQRPHWLTPQYLVHYLFCVNIARKVHPAVNFFNVENELEKYLPQLSMEELSICAMGFFKSQSVMHLPALVEAIMDRVQESASTLSSVPLCSLLKTIRKSSYVTSAKPMEKLLDVLVEQVPRFTLMSCLQIILLPTSIQVYHEPSLLAVVKRFRKDIANARTKELERLTFVLSFYDNKSPEVNDLLDQIIYEFESSSRESEIEQYPWCLMSALRFLAYSQRYPQALLDKVSQPDFLVKTYGKQPRNAGFESVMLQRMLEIEGPTIKFMENKICSSIIKRNMSNPPPRKSPTLSYVYRFIYDVKEILEKILKPVGGGSKEDVHLYLAHVLPHFYLVDLVFCLDSGGKTIPIPVMYINQWDADTKPPPTESGGNNWYCVVFQGRGAFTRNTQEAMGITTIKDRQLRTLGYNVVNIPWFEWEKVEYSNRVTYLQTKLDNARSQVLQECRVTG